MEEKNEMLVEAEVIENDEMFEDSNSGVGGKIALGVAGVGVAAAAIAAGVAAKTGKLKEFNTKRLEKKIERSQKKLDKIRSGEDFVVEAVESTDEK